MMNKLTPSLLLLLAQVLMFANSGLAQEQTSLVFTHVTVIDGTGSPEQLDMTVVIHGDHISALGKTGKTRVPEGAQTMNAAGKFLIPGLWDMHVHLMGSRDLSLSMLVANGITGVRDMGIPFEQLKQVHQWREEISVGKLLGPRIFSPGPILTGSQPPRPVWPGSIAVANEQEARAAVDLLESASADFLKVHNFVPREAYFAIADEAKKRGVPFVGHTPDAVSALEASDNHQKSIEHLTGILLACSTEETQLRKELIEGTIHSDAATAVHVRRQVDIKSLETYSGPKAATLLAHFVKNGTWQVPTLVFLRDAEIQDSGNEEGRLSKYVPRPMRQAAKVYRENMTRKLTPEDIAGGKRVFQKQLQLVNAMKRVGVQLLAGTDLVLYPGFSLHDELGLLVEAGLTPMEALQSATRNPARYFGLEDSLGTIRKGKLADLVLLEGDPLKDIGNTRKISAVVLNGRFVTRSMLDAMLAKAEATANE
jgi:imidazolonepropionase-like amidohydrolase